MGNLEQSQTKAQFRQNLARLKVVYEGILSEAARSGDGTLVPRGGGAPLSDAVTAQSIAAMSPQQITEYMDSVPDLSAIPQDVLDAIIARGEQ